MFKAAKPGKPTQTVRAADLDATLTRPARSQIRDSGEALRRVEEVISLAYSLLTFQGDFYHQDNARRSS